LLGLFGAARLGAAVFVFILVLLLAGLAAAFRVACARLDAAAFAFAIGNPQFKEPGVTVNVYVERVNAAYFFFLFAVFFAAFFFAAFFFAFGM